MDKVKESVSHYYSEVVQTSEDLKTSACCAGGTPPEYLKNILSEIHDDVISRFYGCGFPISEAVSGARVLDLGCGTGRDVFTYSKLVGEAGFVFGIDMTDGQLKVARDTEDFHRLQFGYKDTNTRFFKGFIEDPAAVGIEQNSIDLVISNCVVNLSSDKKAVIDGIYKVLKNGGEFYFSDVFADRRLPQTVVEDDELYGECLGGALYYNDFISLVKRCGFLDPRLVKEAPIELSPSVRDKVGNAQFVSRTYRLFKLADLDDQCEDYGQVAVYRGGIEHHEDLFILDDHHFFEKNRPERVCANTAAMLTESRFGSYFDVVGDTSVHYGEYPCGGTMAYDQYASASASVPASGSCC